MIGYILSFLGGALCMWLVYANDYEKLQARNERLRKLVGDLDAENRKLIENPPMQDTEGTYYQ